VLGKADLDMLLAERESLNEALQQIIDEATDPWGVKVTAVEIKDVEIPSGMQRAMARQAEAERERRAKVIHAEGEFQASQRLADAAQVLSPNPAALQLRYLQTLTEVGVNQNSTIVFPLPIDVIRPFLQAAGAGSDAQPLADAAPNGHAAVGAGKDAGSYRRRGVRTGSARGARDAGAPPQQLNAEAFSLTAALSLAEDWNSRSGRRVGDADDMARELTGVCRHRASAGGRRAVHAEPGVAAHSRRRGDTAAQALPEGTGREQQTGCTRAVADARPAETRST
jgi:hypothetical protein